MATIEQETSAEIVFADVSDLQSLASSATAGWSSATIDNTTTEYLDALLQVALDPANTAPANDLGFHLFFWGAEDSDELPTTGAATGGVVGTEGALTFPSISTTQQSLMAYAFIPYTAQDVAIKSPVYSVRTMLGMSHLPPYWGIAILNFSGAALAASGNTVKWRGIKQTVA